jgi:hypothetical protein
MPKMTLPDGKVVDGVEVAVEESTERWSEIKLDDGTIARVKMTVISAVRAENQFDPMGFPIYSLNMAPTIAIVSVPENLKKTRN